MSTTTPITDLISAHRPGVLINNNGTVQLVGANGLLGIPDLATFNSWGFTFSHVVPANAADKDMSQTGVVAIRTPGQLNPTAVVGGTISVQQDPAFTATHFIANQSQVVLGQWTMKANGEDIKAQQLKITLNYTTTSGNPNQAEGFNNLALFVNGAQVGLTLSALYTSPCSANICSYTFGSSNLFNIPAGTTVTVAVKGDSSLINGTSVTAVRTDLVTPANTFQGATSQFLSPNTEQVYTGTTLSTVSATAALAKNAAYANQNVNSNTQKQKIGSYVIQASSVDGVRVSNLVVGFNGTTLPMTSLANVYVVTPDMPSGSTPVAPPTLNSGTNNFITNFTVPANQTVTVDVYADVGSVTGTASIVTTMMGQGNGVSSNQAVYLNSLGSSSGVAVAGQTITVGNSSLQSAAFNTGASPVPQFVIGGSQNQPAATYTFVASSFGGANITELGFTVTNSAITSVKVGGNTSPVVSGKVLITGLSLAVPVGNSGLDVPVTVNYASTGTNGVADATSLLTLAHIKYIAGGSTVTNGTAGWGDTTTGIIGTGILANPMYLAGTAPTVTIAGSGNVLVTGNPIIGSITITANAAGDLTLTHLPLSFTGSGGVTFNGNQVSVIDHATGNVAGVSTIITGIAPVILTSHNNISAGQSVTYDIEPTITVSGASQSMSMGLGDIADFSFTDVNGLGSPTLIGQIGGVSYIANYPTSQVSIHN